MMDSLQRRPSLFQVLQNGPLKVRFMRRGLAGVSVTHALRLSVSGVPWRVADSGPSATRTTRPFPSLRRADWVSLTPFRCVAVLIVRGQPDKPDSSFFLVEKPCASYTSR